MKKLTMIIHSSLQETLADCLRSIPLLDMFIFSHVEEHSSQMEHDLLLSAYDKVVGYVPQIKVDVIINEKDIVSVMEAIRNSQCQFKGKGVYWISDLAEFGEL